MSSAWRYRRYLLIPLIPLAVVVLWVAVALTLWAIPDPVSGVVLLVAWAGTLYHAARLGRSGWVVAIAIAWPVLLGYWIYVGLGLDRR